MPTNYLLNQSCCILSRPSKIMAVLKMILYKILLVLTGLLISLKIWTFCVVKRLSPLFVSRFGQICQAINREGVTLIRTHRHKYCRKCLDIKLIGMSRFFLQQLTVVLKSLDVGKTYTTNTHLLHIFENAQKQGVLQITDTKKTTNRFLVEAIAFLGWCDLFKVLLSKKHRKTLIKQMYKIKLVRVK
ncbi:MAG: hypothetical protein RR263_00255 [Oscillospiraceae bacterium]